MFPSGLTSTQTPKKNPMNDYEVVAPPSDTVSCMEFSPPTLQQNFLVAGSWANDIRCWEVQQSGQTVPKDQKTHAGPVLDACWSDDGSKVFTASADKTCKAWDLGSSQHIQVAAHDQPIKVCKWIKAPNYSCLMTGSWDKTLKFWDTRQPNPVFTINLPDRCYYADVKYPMAVVGAGNRGVIVYQLENQPTEFKKIDSPLKYQHRCCSIFMDKKGTPTGFAIGSVEGRVAIQYINPTNPKDNFTFKCHRSTETINGYQDIYPVNDIKFHPAHGTLVTVGSDGKFSFWDKDSRTKLKTSDQAENTIPCCAFNARGEIFAYSVGYDWSRGHEYAQPNRTNAIYLHPCFEELKPRSPSSFLSIVVVFCPPFPLSMSFDAVRVFTVSDTGTNVQKWETPVRLKLEYDSSEGVSVKVLRQPVTDISGSGEGGATVTLDEFSIPKDSASTKNIGAQGVLLTEGNLEPKILRFSSETDRKRFQDNVRSLRSQKPSVFSERTEEASASQYFQFYGYLSQQQNMMQDFIRTSTYQRAILVNGIDFENKVVLDVGAGSGILSFFAAHAGAKKVYAVEASSMAEHAATLARENRMNDRIHVISGKIEEIDIPEDVDVIISEPMGYMLFNERMLETFLHAKKWLKPEGKVFPTRGDLHVAPFTDDSLYTEQFNKANFWYQQSFHGIDLCSLREAAMEEYFRQPIVDTFDVRICLAKSVKHSVDFQTASETDLHRIDIPLEFHLLESGTIHGLAFWFDVAFLGSSQSIWLSTAPTEPLTHWYQVRCLLRTPVFAKAGQLLTGRVLLVANKRQSYDVTLDLKVEGTTIRSVNSLDLKNPYFRYTGQAPQPPPGHNTTSPSENYWDQLDTQAARQAVNMVNGMAVNGLGEVNLGLAHAGLDQAAAATAGFQIHPGGILSTQVGQPGVVASATRHGGTRHQAGYASSSSPHAMQTSPPPQPSGSTQVAAQSLYRTPAGLCPTSSQNQFMGGVAAIPQHSHVMLTGATGGTTMLNNPNLMIGDYAAAAGPSALTSHGILK
ncbi:unnamed protein product [Cyprideis torosa]|uniref:type I protein arginine methyltransferase n=1 Tax=Cyprideis torosa TaxID=163714 RepID=A0A7R8W8P2_9CRUS|nr:unnamed protein product [Cyprideis torosa]CAG0886452.1 unnamed protein product [Cyprideis torosa]